MAFVPGRWFTIINMVDNGGDQASKRFELNVADSTEATAAQTALLAAWNNVTDMKVVSYYTFQEEVSDVEALPASGVERENNALLTFEVRDKPNKSASLSIPAPKPAIFVATSGAGAEIVNTANAAVIALRDLFITDPPTVFLSDGESMGTLVKGKRTHRRNSNG
jgi:hypothetical protein